MYSSRREFIQKTAVACSAIALNSTQAAADPLDDIEELDGLALAELVRSKAIKPTELLEAAIRRLEKLNADLNAVVVPMYDEARDAIAKGLPQGQFGGVPFLLKDLGAAYAGVRHTMGSKLFAKNVAEYDDELTKRYKKAGFVTFGRTNTPEFGLNVSTESQLWGPAKNPWDLTRSSGGSSGGSAAAVAARIAPIAHGNDGGGSIRIPASCCGVFGLKPSRGRLPTGPDAGEIWEGFVTDHVITVSVRDSAAVLDETAYAEVGAPYGIPSPERPYLKEVSREPGKLRIAWTDEGGAEEIDDGCKRAVLDAAKLCESLGHIVERAKPEVEYEPLLEAVEVMVDGHTAAMLDQFEAMLGKKVSPDMVEPWTWARAEKGWKASAAEFASTKSVFNQATRSLGRFFEGYDILLTPTLGTVPPLLGVHDTTKPFDKLWRTHFDFIPFTLLNNVTGTPAISVPLYWNEANLPIGVQFAARYANEGLLFRLAGQLERERPWKNRRPRI